ncbi:MAG: CoA-binding protein [Candidatus Methylomirabilales bacterium]
MAILVDEKTRILIQGITGREGAAMAKDSVEYGAQIVAGVTPGKGGRQIHGVSVYDCVSHAVKEHGMDAAVIAVPPPFARDAALEALSCGIGLVVILTERIPRKDTVEIVSFAAQQGAHVIGPNSLGIISPGKTKVGMIGGPAQDVRKAYQPGAVGIISRSGGMTTEIATLLTLNGIGQSTCVSIGGDPIVGTHYLDLIPLFARDPATAVVVLFCEPGGGAEEALADRVAREGLPVPIVAFVAGRFADRMPGTRFGHAAVMVEGKRGSTQGKIEAFRRAGLPVAEELTGIVPLVREALGREKNSSGFRVHGSG